MKSRNQESATRNALISPGLGRKLKKEVLSNMDIIKRQFEVHAEIKSFAHGKDASGADGLIIEGYASTKDLDRGGEIVEPQAFAEALAGYMENPIVTYMHDWMNPIGKTLAAEITEMGLYVKVFISSAAGQVVKLIEDGILRAFSIGYNIISDAVEEEIYHIKKLELYEVAVVSIPMNRRCLFNLAKALTRGTDLVCADCAKCDQATERTENTEEIREPWNGCKRCGLGPHGGPKCTKMDCEEYRYSFPIQNLKSGICPDVILSEAKNLSFVMFKIWEETENEIRHRVRDPKEFEEDSFRRITLKKDKPRVFAIIGRLKGETKTTIQAIRFPKEDGWTMESAKQWMKDHPDVTKAFLLISTGFDGMSDEAIREELAKQFDLARPIFLFNEFFEVIKEFWPESFDKTSDPAIWNAAFNAIGNAAELADRTDQIASALEEPLKEVGALIESGEV